MDEIDRRIIAELVADGRLSATELSDRVALSLSATAQRLRRLVDNGTITRFTVDLDPVQVGRLVLPGAEWTDIAVAHVIDENDNEVRLQAEVLLRLERAGAEEERRGSVPPRGLQLMREASL